VAVDLSARSEAALSVAASVPPPGGTLYRQGILDVAFASMDTMQNTITRLKAAACSPDVTIGIPRNACGFHEFWRAAEMIALGRERAARAFATSGKLSAAVKSPEVLLRP